MDRKKVLFLAGDLPVGGSEIFLLNLLNGLDPAAVSPVVVSLGSREDGIFTRIPSRIPKYVHQRRWRYDFSPSVRIRERIAEYGVDTVFCSGLFPFLFLRRALAGDPGQVRVILSVHGTAPRSTKEAVFTWLYCRMLTGREEIITVSNDQRDFFVRRYGISPHQFRTIYNGIDTGLWIPRPGNFDRAAFRERWGIPREAVVIVNVAMFREEKRHDIMMRAMTVPEVASFRVPVYLVFVGDGDSRTRTELFRRAGDLGVEGRIVFAGLQDDVRPFCWMSDLFTLASTSETLSLATLEALSTGLPSVITDVGGAGEIITHGFNGLLVPPGSAAELAKAWITAADCLGDFSGRKIRADVVDRFDLQKSLSSYRELLLDDTAGLQGPVRYGCRTPYAGAGRRSMEGTVQ